MKISSTLDAFEIDEGGWVRGAQRIPSPNFDARPEGVLPELVLIHNISLPPDQFGGGEIADFFCNALDHDAHPFFEQIRGVRVSAHFLIRRDGALQQFVPCGARAWHAGASDFFGRQRCNDFSLGIELEGSDDVPFEPAQYQTLAALTQALLAHYPVTAIAGHADVAPGRKTDPGPHFEWDTYRRLSGLSAGYFPYLAERH